MIRRISATLTLCLLSVVAMADPVVLPMKDRAAVIDRWLTSRVETVLPMLMRRTGIDMWVIISREYNEDPVIRTMLPSTWHAARRTTILLVYDRGEDEPLETLAVSRYDVGEMFRKAWDKEQDGEQWAHLGKLIAERNPEKIGLNFSETFALADGISHSEYELFNEALPEDLRDGLSAHVIQPGVTTTDDVVWWYRDRIRELKLTTWFQPSVSIDRAEAPETTMGDWALKRYDSEVILPGDLLHVDFGITYLRLNTDTQQHAYVLKPGESDAPEELKVALANGNRLQDILTGQFESGRYRALDLHASHRLSRSRRRADDRHVGQPGRHAGPGRLPAVSEHRTFHRAVCGDRSAELGQVGAYQAGGRCVLRRRKYLLHRRAAEGVPAHSASATRTVGERT